jgi:putative transposase
MAFNPEQHHRRSIRLDGYDYAGPGAYFVTACAYRRAALFGAVRGGATAPNRFGRVAEEEWARSAAIRPGIILDAFVVMPNHIHGIVILTEESQAGVEPPEDVGAHSCAPLQRRCRSLSSFMAAYKAAVTKRINALRGTAGAPAWQRNYYERVLRDERELGLARQYVADNPTHWEKDVYYP